MSVLLNNVGIQLSREELLYMLYLIKTDYILGLEPDPMGKMSTEQIELGLVFAERSLRARELAAIDNKGDLQVDSSLLAMIEACAYSDFVVALHYFQPEGLRQKIFWHRRQGLIVKHTIPSAELHHFSFTKEGDLLINEILSYCNISQPKVVNLPKFQVKSDLLGAVKESANVDMKKAIELLTEVNVPADSAYEICTILSGKYSIAALHLAHQSKNNELAKNELTVLSGETSTWMMKDIGEGNALLFPVSEPEIAKTLAEMF